MSMMKLLIIGISVVAAVAFLLLSIMSIFQIFNQLLYTSDSIRGELWVLLILSFTAGVIMLSIAWGITELGESRRAQRDLMRSGRLPMPDDDDE